MKKTKRLSVFLSFLFFLLVTAFLTCFSFSHTEKESDSTDLDDGLSYLHALETRDVAGLQAEIAKAEQPSEEESAQESSFAAASSAEDFIAAHQGEVTAAAIPALSESQRAEYKARMESCVIIGDSMAQAALEYGFLDSSHVFYKRGAAIGELGEQIEQASSMLPTTVIFFTGLNDTDYYPEISDYQNAYLEKLQYARSLMPQAAIYVCSMLPPSNAFGATRPDLARAPYYDIALRDMCQSSGFGYLDTNWMVNQALYMNDGIHFVSSFYDLWIQYICVCTGL